MGADLCDLGELDLTGLGRQFGWIPQVLFQYQETCFVWSFYSISLKTPQWSAKLNFQVLCLEWLGIVYVKEIMRLRITGVKEVGSGGCSVSYFHYFHWRPKLWSFICLAGPTVALYGLLKPMLHKLTHFFCLKNSKTKQTHQNAKSLHLGINDSQKSAQISETKTNSIM